MNTPAVGQPTHLAAAGARPDTRDMVVVHTAFRREFGLAGSLVRAIPDGDKARTTIICKHLELITLFLHHHHEGEDRLLWPMLLERVDEHLAPVILLMEAHHEAISAHLDLVEGIRARFAASAAALERDKLATACDRLYQLLGEHLRAEEVRLLPLAARYLSEQEWATMGEEGLGTRPKDQVPLALGMMMYEGDPEVIAMMLSSAPKPIRLVGPFLGRRAFRRYAQRVHGTSTP